MHEINLPELKTRDMCKPEDLRLVTIIQSNVDKAIKRAKIMKIAGIVNNDSARADAAIEILTILGLWKS